MSTRFVGLVTVSLLTLPLLAACNSKDDSKPAPATVSRSEHQRLHHVTAQGRRYCADVKAGHKRPAAVHLTNCGHQPFDVTYKGKNSGSKTVKPGQKVWLKAKSGTYHGFALTLMGPDNTVVGLFTLE